MPKNVSKMEALVIFFNILDFYSNSFFPLPPSPHTHTQVSATTCLTYSELPFISVGWFLYLQSEKAPSDQGLRYHIKWILMNDCMIDLDRMKTLFQLYVSYKSSSKYGQNCNWTTYFSVVLILCGSTDEGAPVSSFFPQYSQFDFLPVLSSLSCLQI